MHGSVVSHDGAIRVNRTWRKAYPEKNRAIRRNQYRKSVAAKSRISSAAKIRIGRSHRQSAK